MSESEENHLRLRVKQLICGSINGMRIRPSLLQPCRRVMKSLSRVRLFATPWTVAYQAPPSMGSSRQEYWSRLPFPSPGNLPNPGIEPKSPVLQADSLPTELQGKPWKMKVSFLSLASESSKHKLLSWYNQRSLSS